MHHELLSAVLCLLLSGCATSGPEYVTLHDVDPRLGGRFERAPSLNAFYDHDGTRGPEREAHRVGWTDLCGTSSCDATRRRYTALFRRAAVALGTSIEVDFVLSAVADEGLQSDDERELLIFVRRQFPDASARYDALMLELQGLDPQRDFANSGQAKLASAGLQTAVRQCDDALARLEIAALTLEEMTDAPSTDLVVFAPTPLEFDPMLDERVRALRARLLAQPAAPPADRLSDEDVVNLALTRGLVALDQELQMREQIAAAARQPQMLLGVLEGPEQPLLAWFLLSRPLLTDCIPPGVVGELTVAGLHGPEGKFTALQIVESTLPTEAVECLRGSLHTGTLELAHKKAGTFKFRLTTERPEWGLAETIFANDSATFVTRRARRTAEEIETEREAFTVRTADAGVAERLPVWSQPAPERTQAALAWVVVGVGSSSLVTGGILGVLALDTRAKTRNSLASSAIREVDALAAQQRYKRLGTGAIIAGSTGAALLGVSIAALLRPREPIQQSSLSWSPAGITWTRHF